MKNPKRDKNLFSYSEGMLEDYFIMPNCRYHPDREGIFPCLKHQIAYCLPCFEEGQPCSDPKLYCKFRPQCLINESQKEREDDSGSKFKVQSSKEQT
jgi:hypothetical protein